MKSIEELEKEHLKKFKRLDIYSNPPTDEDLDKEFEKLVKKPRRS